MRGDESPYVVNRGPREGPAPLLLFVRGASWQIDHHSLALTYHEASTKNLDALAGVSFPN